MRGWTPLRSSVGDLRKTATALLDPIAETPPNPLAEHDAHIVSNRQSGPLNHKLAFALGIFHLLALAALFFFSWSAFAVAAVLWVLAQNIASA